MRMYSKRGNYIHLKITAQPIDKAIKKHQLSSSDDSDDRSLYKNHKI